MSHIGHTKEQAECFFNSDKKGPSYLCLTRRNLGIGISVDIDSLFSLVKF